MWQSHERWVLVHLEKRNKCKIHTDVKDQVGEKEREILILSFTY